MDFCLDFPEDVKALREQKGKGNAKEDGVYISCAGGSTLESLSTAYSDGKQAFKGKQPCFFQRPGDVQSGSQFLEFEAGCSLDMQQDM